MDHPSSNDRLTRPALLLFAVLLAAHFFLATRNWHAAQLPGHEFRQTQTALATLFIARENNFSPAYPTPLLGKPWSIPMEFPLYQWTVVGVQRATGWALPESGRAVSLLCFYLALPAFFVLLGAARLSRGERLVVLGFLLSGPLYIFYARAFLIETMALMFAVWFTAAFVRMLQTRDWRWFLLATFSGAAAGLVKVTTLLIWMLPAAAYAVHLLWSQRPRRGAAPGSFVRTLGWGLGSVLLPCLFSVWWVRFADAIKALNPSARFLTSANLAWLNFGTLAQRFSGETWHRLLDHWQEAVMPLSLMAVLVVAGLRWARSRGWLVLLAGATFLGSQLLFPELFARHDYYFCASAAAALVAAGLIAATILGRVRPAWPVWLLVVVVHAVQLDTYRREYSALQNHPSNGGTAVTEVLRQMTPVNSVLLISGEDWSALSPYYAQRRALMFVSEPAVNLAQAEESMTGLANEDVAALLLTGKERSNRELIARAHRHFNIQASPAFSWKDTDVYLAETHAEAIIRRLQGANPYAGLVLAAQSSTTSVTEHPLLLVPVALHDTVFAKFTPKPTRYRFDAGLGLTGDQNALGAHPVAELWFTPPPAAREIVWEFGLNPDAYTKAGDHTDGVEFVITEHNGSATKEIYRRLLDPEKNPADRGTQVLRLPYQPAAGGELVFSTGPGPLGSFAYDWAYWQKIEIR